MNIRQFIENHTHGTFKIRIRHAGKVHGRDVFIEHNCTRGEALRIAKDASRDGQEATVFKYLINGDWEPVEDDDWAKDSVLRQLEVDHGIRPWKKTKD